MSYKKIVVIGVGSLGGFLSESLSYLCGLKKLFLIDYDKVEESNIGTSIYRSCDIGKPKVDSIKKIILVNNPNPDLEIITKQWKFVEIEDSEFIKGYDLVFDCRDYTYDRFGSIDVRLSFSVDSIIADCRKKVRYDTKYEGQYKERLSRASIKKGISEIIMLVETKSISKLIESEADYIITLNDLDDKVYSRVISKDQELDLIMDRDNLISNISSEYSSVINMNKTSDITICLNRESSTKTIPIESLHSIFDVKKELIDILPENNFQPYFIFVDSGKSKIILLPENGDG